MYSTAPADWANYEMTLQLYILRHGGPLPFKNRLGELGEREREKKSGKESERERERGGERKREREIVREKGRDKNQKDYDMNQNRKKETNHESKQ